MNLKLQKILKIEFNEEEYIVLKSVFDKLNNNNSNKIGFSNNIVFGEKEQKLIDNFSKTLKKL